MTFWEGLRLINVKVLIFVRNSENFFSTILRITIELIFFLITKKIELFTF